MLKDNSIFKKNQVCLLLGRKKYCGSAEFRELLESNWFRRWKDSVPGYFVERFLERRGFREMKEEKED